MHIQFLRGSRASERRRRRRVSLPLSVLDVKWM